MPLAKTKKTALYISTHAAAADVSEHHGAPLPTSHSSEDLSQPFMGTYLF
jgi:hypothetical protein